MKKGHINKIGQGDKMGLTKKQLLECVDTMNSGFMITDPKGIVQYFNQAYVDLTKLPNLKVGTYMSFYRQQLRSNQKF